MEIEDIISKLNSKYGDEFNWSNIPLSEKTDYFVNELMKELGQEHIIFKQKVYSVARNESNDDVLFLLCDNNDNKLYRIYHLTYSIHNLEGYPKFEEFSDVKAVEDFIEKQYIEEYL